MKNAFNISATPKAETKENSTLKTPKRIRSWSRDSKVSPRWEGEGSYCPKYMR